MTLLDIERDDRRVIRRVAPRPVLALAPREDGGGHGAQGGVAGRGGLSVVGSAQPASGGPGDRGLIDVSDLQIVGCPARVSEVELAQVIARLERSGGGQQVARRVAVGYLAAERRVSKAQVRRKVGVAESLAAWPSVRGVAFQGLIERDKIAVLATGLGSLPSEQATRAVEEGLLGEVVDVGVRAGRLAVSRPDEPDQGRGRIELGPPHVAHRHGADALRCRVQGRGLPRAAGPVGGAGAGRLRAAAGCWACDGVGIARVRATVARTVRRAGR